MLRFAKPVFVCRVRFTAIMVANLLLAFEFCKAEESNQDWAQFLGPHRNGISSETGLLNDWPANGPKEVWRAKSGVGMSGVSISRGRVLTMIQTDGKQKVIALNAKNGKPMWQTDVANEYSNRMGDGPRATPTVSGGKVFTFTGEGILSALNFEDGQLLWAHDAVSELGGKVADYGMAGSPLVIGSKVVVIAGAPGATAACYDSNSGDLLWKAGKDPAGYSSPTLLKAGGREQVVAFTGTSVIGIDSADGSLLWRYPFVTDYRCNTATPISIDGCVLISSGENHGSVLLSLSPKGSGFEVAEKWTQLGVKSTLRSEWQTPVLLDGYLYGMDNVGSAGQITHLTCVDAKTGERVWSQRRFGKGNLIAADGKLFISTMKGELVVVQASPKGFLELGRKVIIGRTRQSPSLSGGFLYMRGDKEIVCLDVRE